MQKLHKVLLFWANKKYEEISNMDVKVLILGRTGAGKDTVSKHLTDAYGYKQVLSYATRPKRFPEENTHIFITPEEAKTLTNRVAETTIGEYEYFATKEQVQDSDLYVIDPDGCYELLNKMPETNFIIINLVAPEDIRRERCIGRGDDSVKERERFISRNTAENERFNLFEKVMAGTAPEYNFKRDFPNVVLALKMVNGRYSDPKILADAIDNAKRTAIAMKNIEIDETELGER